MSDNISNNDDIKSNVNATDADTNITDNDNIATHNMMKIPAPAVFSIAMNGTEHNGLTPKRLAKRLQRFLDSIDAADASYDVDYISASSYGGVCEALAESYAYGEQIRGSIETVVNGDIEYGQAARKLCDGFMDEYDAFKRSHPDNSALDAISRADRIVVVKRTYIGSESTTTASFVIKVFEIARAATAEKRMSEAKAITSGLRTAFGIGENDSNAITVTADGSLKHSPFAVLSNWVDKHIDADHDVLRLVAIGTGVGAIASAITGSASAVAWLVVSALFWIAYHLGDFGGNGLVLDMIFKLDSVGMLAGQPRVTLRYSHTMVYFLVAIIILSLMYPLLF